MRESASLTKPRFMLIRLETINIAIITQSAQFIYVAACGLRKEGAILAEHFIKSKHSRDSKYRFLE